MLSASLNKTFPFFLLAFRRFWSWRLKVGFLEPLFLLESPKNTIKIFYKLLILAHFITPLFIINKFYVHEKYGFIQTSFLFYLTLCSKNIHIAFIINI